MRLRFCGVRGSTAAPGADFVQVGGHTSCVAVTPDGAGAPRLLLDAGTGIRAVTDLLGGAPFHGTILLTHLHWDHTQGIPFFAAGDRDGARVHVLVPDAGDETSAFDLLARGMSPPQFPIGPDLLHGRWTFATVDEGRHRVEGLDLLVREVPHKGGRTLGFRLDDATGSVAYLPDHAPAPDGPARAAALELAAGVDVLVHGGQFVAAEAERAHDYGHAVVDEALQLAIDAGARRLVLTHHAPGRTDAEVAAVERSLRHAPLPVAVAREGDEWTPSGRG